jgi:glycosyltransferase involved in cell wall biosynthesis
VTVRPLVTVLTPVYNGEAYLAECIESIQAQTYDHWEYVLVDNASTDGTPELLRAYAARDPRVRIVTNERLVPVIENHNIAARQVSAEARWCKFVSADDLLFPDCLDRMVAAGEAHPSVGLVTAYQLQGTAVGLGGLAYPSLVTPGRTVCRQSLLGLLHVFGAPTSHMIRADFVRGRDPFYDASDLHADTAACYEVLQSSDLAFVHQVLTYARLHRESLTVSRARRLNTYLLGHMRILAKYGPVYLTPAEYARVLRRRLDVYYTFLVRARLAPGGREIWTYHRDGLRALGVPVSRRRLVGAMLHELARVLLSPGTEVPKAFRLLHPPRVEDLSWHQWWAPTGFEAVDTRDLAMPITDVEPMPDRPTAGRVAA